ncbi:MAG: 2-oxo-hepta-3-ene-1,7-dioic acid hydratase [Phyllobacteriaceae bacterium]|nr:2-oxo-hepta-3-ene-1,7-dioic acid hydratase [Phyllobacteriaceae bacterium]
MTPREIEAAALALDEAERTRRQIGLLSLAHPDMTMDDAYAIQAAWARRKIAAGRAVRGWKIGLTSKAMQQALNIDIPDSGVLLDDMIFANGDTIPKDRFIQPRIEAEIAFVMKTDLSGPACSPADVLAATEFVAPALEILDTRILRLDPATKKPRTIVDTISDNAANAGIVLGRDRHNPLAFDLRWVGAIVSRNGEVEETGLGAGVLNDPALAVAWLANRLAAYGESIRAGDVVLSGSFIRPLEAPPGSRIEADFGAFGQVSCRFG